jgi:hypothetical protein
MSRVSPSAPRWEAILSAVEQDPGHWHMHAGTNADEDPYACIRLLEIDVRDRGRLKRYRVVEWHRNRADRRLVGYYDALKRACEEARRHQAGLVSRATHASRGEGAPPWGLQQQASQPRSR